MTSISWESPCVLFFFFFWFGVTFQDCAGLQPRACHNLPKPDHGRAQLALCCQRHSSGILCLCRRAQNRLKPVAAAFTVGSQEEVRPCDGFI